MQLQDKLIQPSSHVSERRESCVVGVKPIVRKIAHQRNEIRSKVPGPAVNLQDGKDLLAPATKKCQQSIQTVEIERNIPIPLETLKESAIECSTLTSGPVNIRVQTPLIPIELGEKRRVYNSTVVNIQHRSEEASSPNVSVGIIRVGTGCSQVESTLYSYVDQLPI